MLAWLMRELRVYTAVTPDHALLPRDIQTSEHDLGTLTRACLDEIIRRLAVDS